VRAAVEECADSTRCIPEEGDRRAEDGALQRLLAKVSGAAGDVPIVGEASHRDMSACLRRGDTRVKVGHRSNVTRLHER
jgi:hypothetical protein